MRRKDAKDPKLDAKVPPTLQDRSLIFWVAGRPVTQGSKQGFVRNGRVRLVESGGKGLAAWRHAVNDEARRAWAGAPLLAGPLEVETWFAMPRPQSLPKKKRTWPIGARSGDVDKLARACLDGMTDVVMSDDAQVVCLHVEKDWAGVGAAPGVWIIVREVRE